MPLATSDTDDIPMKEIVTVATPDDIPMKEIVTVATPDDEEKTRNDDNDDNDQPITEQTIA